MKKEINKLAKAFGIDITIDISRREFDVYDYTIYCQEKEDTFVYYTGKTNTGIEYPFNKGEFLEKVSDFLKTKPINSQSLNKN